MIQNLNVQLSKELESLKKIASEMKKSKIYIESMGSKRD